MPGASLGWRRASSANDEASKDCHSKFARKDLLARTHILQYPPPQVIQRAAAKSGAAGAAKHADVAKFWTIYTKYDAELAKQVRRHADLLLSRLLSWLLVTWDKSRIARPESKLFYSFSSHAPSHLQALIKLWAS
jgi:hypothetical protein